MIKNKEFNQKIFHMIAGFAIIMKGVSKLESLPKAIPLILIGAVFICVGIWHDKLHHAFKKLDVFSFLLEAVVMGILCYSYFSAGKTYIQYVYLVLIPVYLFLSFRANKKHSKLNQFELTN